ncbi:hypothetical protein F2Q69_00036486 [Brassica cretica]|uniref:Transmembrane protein n=1 Tax=Brassica cretica TaxID=69181 RepID=A0A8S9SGS2_BRACR|nr:hypothetical protein F2Q69_00036486 [Brassica cretica]
MKSFDDGLISDMKSFDDGCWFSTLSCFLASPLGVTRVLFSCVAFVPLLVWVEYYKNKWLVWLHCGVRNLIEWRLCLSLNQVYISFSFIIYVKSDARYLSEIVVWPGWTRRGGIFFFGYGGIPWDRWSYDYVICSKDWYLAGDGWCYVTVLRWLTWFYFGSKRSTWGQGDGGMLGSWMLGINRGGVFSILGYMDLNGFSALCVCTLSCFLASPLGVTRVLFSCVAFVPLLVWVEYYKNKWLVWLHCGVRNLIEWRLCLSLNQDWYLAGDGWCYVTVLRWLTWFYFGSKRSTWGQGDGGMLGSWMLGINRGGVFSILGYMDLNGFSALCV